MNNQYLEKFEVVDTEFLSLVSGGSWQCYVGTAGGIIFGVAAGGPWGGLAAGAITNTMFCGAKVS